MIKEEKIKKEKEQLAKNIWFHILQRIKKFKQGTPCTWSANRFVDLEVTSTVPKNLVIS